MSRLSGIAQSIMGGEDPDDLMIEIMEALNDTVTPIPDVGEFYVFVYNPKTPEIKFDQNPFVAVTKIYSWGFRGLNFHWGENRQYTWNEIAGQLYQVTNDEINDLEKIPFAKFRFNY
ncbi:MAG: hypothetical protein CMG75_10685 [Candidatus Marinimicrobia bacterium]|nr:hypothetical protein [Candidatus Neomarinimicrobiota bacterium]|tara:strand:+ start:397 stop:747 length:351 start_codon:yes stop_codon:yes gene_type:complete